jgi:hypothetical protein
MVYWHVLSFFLGMRIKNVDVIISPSPPLTIALVSIALAKLKKRNLYIMFRKFILISL